MKLFIYIFLFSQFLNYLDVFAEKVKKVSPKLNSVEWKKINVDKSNNLKKIIWKSYKDDESYFQNKDDKSPMRKEINNLIEKNKYKSQEKTVNSITELEPYLPLNNFLEYGDFQSTVRWKSSFSGGASDGIGQQNPSFVFDYRF